jgi:hypothetical protein
MNKSWQILILVVLAIVIIIAVPKKQDNVMTPVATNFETCQQAGGILTDGDPVICTMPDGSKFEEAEAQPEVILDLPKYGALVSSPMKVSGQARGNWFFEANIPVTLKDQNGKVLAQQGMQADADWMTTAFVPFSGTMVFATPTTDFGVLIISKDNPSGDPKYDSSYAIPVRFK